MALRTSSTKNNNDSNKIIIMTIILRIIITVMITNIEISTMIIAIIIRAFKCKCLECWHLKEIGTRFPEDARSVRVGG